MLEGLVTAELDRAPGVDGKRIHAYVQDGTVHLQGTARFLYQKLAAERVAADVPGVRSVTNEISVTG